ncbi:MAG: type II toxin-antitoxin system RelB/DinJ family antitoxin [Ottowia sp.]|nr:type II toxin-antitoxin system RelB/DinJ family antitoxin [Ottowia sp.]
MTASVATSDAFVRARVGADIKQRAGAALDAMGLSISDAIRLLLVRVANEGRLPFELAAPWATPQRLAEQAESVRAEAALANWEAFLKEPPVDVDFRALCPPSTGSERVERFLEGWQ